MLRLKLYRPTQPHFCTFHLLPLLTTLVMLAFSLFLPQDLRTCSFVLVSLHDPPQGCLLVIHLLSLHCISCWTVLVTRDNAVLTEELDHASYVFWLSTPLLFYLHHGGCVSPISMACLRTSGT